MKSLIPLMALLVVSGAFLAPAAMAGGDNCADGDSCCKNGAKTGAKKLSKKSSKDAKAQTKASVAK